jgi:hypothetical protein
MKSNIYIIFSINLLCYGFVSTITLADHKSSQIEVDFFRFLFPFDEFFNETNSTDETRSTSVATLTTSLINLGSSDNVSTVPSTLSQVSVDTITLNSSLDLPKTTDSTISQSTPINSQLIVSTISNQNQNVSLDQIQPPSDYILHRLYRKFLQHIKRQSYPSIKINPSQTVNTNIPADLNVCTDQFSTNENGNTYCMDSTGEKRPVYEVGFFYSFFHNIKNFD